MSRYFLTFSLALLLASCGNTHSDLKSSASQSNAGQATAGGEQLDTVTKSLLEYAGSDFSAHSRAATQVRNVRVGHLLTAKGEKLYLLCGEFVPEDSESKAGWATVATIKTDPYEQWLGGQAESWCRNAKVNWEENGGDLSSALRSRLDSPK